MYKSSQTSPKTKIKNKKNLNVCMITSVHSRNDTRIFHKEALSLAKAGYNITMVVADQRGDEIKNEIKIFDVGAPIHFGRIERFTLIAFKVFKKASKLDSDIYHFHDPELIPFGLLLRLKNKQVIYDVHEDLPRQIMNKHYIPKGLKNFIAWAIEILEDNASKLFSAVFTATPHIRNRFKKNNKNTIDIKNYPKTKNFKKTTLECGQKEKVPKICYIGALTESRGISELVDAIEGVDCQLQIAGHFSPKSFRNKMTGKSGWKKVHELGFLNHDNILSILKNSHIGMVTLHPIVNYLDSLPIKMFEYMAAGLPVIASNFPLWEKIINENDCGICVDPENPIAIAKQIDRLLKDRKLASRMGRNGIIAVKKKYNWELEEKKMINCYEDLGDMI